MREEAKIFEAAPAPTVPATNVWPSSLPCHHLESETRQHYNPRGRAWASLLPCHCRAPSQESCQLWNSCQSFLGRMPSVVIAMGRKKRSVGKSTVQTISCPRPAARAHQIKAWGECLLGRSLSGRRAERPTRRSERWRTLWGRIVNREAGEAARARFLALLTALRRQNPLAPRGRPSLLLWSACLYSVATSHRDCERAAAQGAFHT
mmetsp:Transcript_5730/g.17620  ORF Transcript_5730/g.17620 Transcript_5730/m.17620 type:complete len:206 (-) Transcript_5730:1035-1652(-)